VLVELGEHEVHSDALVGIVHAGEHILEHAHEGLELTLCGHQSAGGLHRGHRGGIGHEGGAIARERAILVVQPLEEMGCGEPIDGGGEAFSFARLALDERGQLGPALVGLQEGTQLEGLGALEPGLLQQLEVLGGLVRLASVEPGGVGGGQRPEVGVEALTGRRLEGVELGELGPAVRASW
jgi:hypothetical protein